MFLTLLFLFVILRIFKMKTYLNCKNIDGYDNRNLTSFDENEKLKNITIFFYKYELLKKLESDNYNMDQKLELIYNHDIINPVNLGDW